MATGEHTIPEMHVLQMQQHRRRRTDGPAWKRWAAYLGMAAAGLTLAGTIAKFLIPSIVAAADLQTAEDSRKAHVALEEVDKAIKVEQVNQGALLNSMNGKLDLLIQLNKKGRRQ
jgi:hypothetical protein